MKKNVVKWLLAFVALLVVAGALWGVYQATRPEPVQGNKTITVLMQYDDVNKTVSIQTDHEYLRGALEQENLVIGDESEYGLFVTAVNGREADNAKQEWWCFTKGGETLNTGIDTTPIADGDSFEVTLKTGW